MKPAAFEYHAPGTLDEAVALLSEFAPQDARVIAGGQSMVPMMAFRLARPGHLIDINQIAGLDELAVEEGWLRIGATVRHAALETMSGAGTLGGLLRCVAGSVAHRPIRNRGTFCGSLAHADPSAEWSLVAVTLGAEIEAHSARGVRVLPAEGFFQGVMTTALEPDEIVTEARIRLLDDDARAGFDEVSRRAGDFAMAAGLVTYRLVSGRMSAPRIGIGGVEPCPRRLAQAEAILDGAIPGHVVFARAAEAAAAEVDPMEDGNITPAYRRQLTRAVILRALERSAD